MFRWFPNLDTLYAEIPRDTITTNNYLVISKDVLFNHKAIKNFACVPTPESLWQYVQSVPPTDRCFYECIIGERKQKPHFDIDIATGDTGPNRTKGKVTAPDTIDQVAELAQRIIDDVVDALLDINISLRDIRIYTSHGHNKRSFHIVLPEVYCTDNNHAKQLWQYVANKLNQEAAAFVDSNVYSTFQQFRLIGSCKLLAPDRIKVLNKTFVYRGVNISLLPASSNAESQFYESLVSYVPISNTIIPELAIAVESPKVRSTVDLTDELIDTAMDIFNECEWIDGGHGVFRKIIGNLIILKRIRPSYCKTCDETHKHNNAFLLVYEVNKDEWLVMYSCYKAKEKRKLGLINLHADEPETPKITLTPEEPVKRLRKNYALIDPISHYAEPNLKTFGTVIKQQDKMAHLAAVMDGEYISDDALVNYKNPVLRRY